MIIKIVEVGDVPEKLVQDLPQRLMESFALLADDCKVGETI